MATSFRRESAKIYEFPQKLRAGLRGPHEDQKAADFQPRQLPEVEFGSGWYHEVAVQEADRTRKP